MNTRTDAVAQLEQAIGYEFADRELLERALTHSSVGDGARAVSHYQRLEFLGDRVLNLLAAERLMLDADAEEGEMSRRMAALVSTTTCARVARRIGLSPALRLSPSATKVGARDSDNVLGDACEALIGAIYMDAGLEGARGFFGPAWDPEFERLAEPGLHDPKTRLQEWAQGQKLPLPIYHVAGRTGPDHAPDFTVEVVVETYPPERAQGKNKQEAEKAAALAMLRKHAGIP